MGQLKVVVFDLDYTLWPFWIDTHVLPPFKKVNGEIYDGYNSKVKYYPEVPSVLQDLTKRGYEIAIASRTTEGDAADNLIKLFGWDKYIMYKDIYPGCKVTHFNSIKRKTNKQFDEMIFFDDEHRNIKDIRNLGVVSILVKNGISSQVVEDGFAQYFKETHHRNNYSNNYS